MQCNLGLRCIDAATIAQRNILLRARAASVSLARLEQAQRYVALPARLDSRDCTGFVLLQQLIDYWLDDATLPASQMDGGIVRRFIEDAFRSQGLPSPSESVVWSAPNGWAQGEDYEKPLFLLRGGPFDLFLPHLPADFCAADTGPLPNLPVPIRFSLGTLRRPASSLVGLAAGDIAPVPARPGLALVGDKPIFSFEVHGDSLMIGTIFDDDLGDLDDDGFAAHSDGSIKVEDLPVTLSFVLSERTMRIAEIGALQPGLTLPLEHPVAYVNIMAGPIRLARGELVRIANDLGVEVIEVYPVGTDATDPGTPR